MFSVVTHCFVLAAGNHRLSHMGSRFRDQSSSRDVQGVLIFLLAACVIGVVAWALVAANQRWKNRVVDSPRGLFKELCRAHGLTRADRSFLEEIAEWFSLTDPIQLFVDPSLLRSPEMRAALDCDEAAGELEARLFA